MVDVCARFTEEQIATVQLTQIGSAEGARGDFDDDIARLLDLGDGPFLNL
jgi:hypothetical protein